MSDLAVVQAQRDLITEFLGEHPETFTDGVDCDNPVVVDYVWVLAIQDACAPFERPWYAVATATDVTYRNLGLLDAARDLLSAPEDDDVDS